MSSQEAMGSGGSKSTTDLAAKTEKAEATPAEQQAQTPPPAPVAADATTAAPAAVESKPKYKGKFVFSSTGDN